MPRLVAACLSAVVTLLATGCASEPHMTTRTYALTQGDTSWQAVSAVLDDEWRRHDVMSNADRHGDTAAVRTTARAHREIGEALSAE